VVSDVLFKVVGHVLRQGAHVEPSHCSCSHFVTPFFRLGTALRIPRL
jgi:hypothetical protein